MKKYDIIVIGAGASGMIAAIRAGQLGAKVLIIEKMMKVGRKLRITGKGKGNVTNSANIINHINKFEKNGKFLHQVYNKFFNKELCIFLENIGIKTIEKRGGRIFPESESAQDLVDSFFLTLKKFNIDLILNAPVTNIVKCSNNLIKTTYIINKVTSESFSQKVIIATGGASYPKTGSEGDGYKLCNSLGHKIIKPKPYLVALEAYEKIPENLDKFILKNVKISLIAEGKKISQEFGEIMFLKYGLGGASVLKLSKYAVPKILEKNQLKIKIDLKPALNEKQLDNRLLKEINDNKNNTILNLLTKLIPLNVVLFFLDDLNIDKKLTVNNINKELRKKIRNKFKDWTFNISKFRPLEEAIITSGGVNLKEIDPNTLESKINKNIYIVGELLDLAAETGGYNLQAAFSTGYIAGESAKESLKL